MSDNPLPIRQRNSGVRNTYRLALKELKEILRDRRTIITLVGMPLLIYPLLSILFQKFYFSSAAGDKKVAYEFVLEESILDADGNPVEDPESVQQSTEEELVKFIAARYTNLGEAYLYQELPPRNAIRLLDNPGLDPQFIRSGELRYFTENKFQVRTPDAPPIEELVKSGEADVGIRLIRGPNGPASIEIIQQEIGVSAAAATYLRKRIQATNLALAKIAIANARQPVRYQQSQFKTQVVEGATVPKSVSMASLVPLILILMTVTGAVYPAIDLTAGERERGTLEALIAAPVPRFQVLFAKFIGVLTVALLTAVVNMAGMFSTLAVFGLLPILFGESSFSLLAIAQVFALLILFAGFFSAVLLAVTSFARSFKEAQAYIVPLMLLSITPGIISLTPGLELSGPLSVVPLVNIVLLAREIMEGTATPIPAIIAVTSTSLYGLAALSVAASIFGSDSILYGSQTSWRAMLRRSSTPTSQILLSRALACLAIIFPLSFLSIGIVGRVPQWVADLQGVKPEEVSYWYSLIPFVISTVVVFVITPSLFLWHGRTRVPAAVGLRFGNPVAYLAAVLIGVCLWPLVGQLVDSLNQLIAAASDQSGEPEWKQQLLEKAKEIVARWRTISPIAIVLCFSVLPAICEEFFFRGVLLRALLINNKRWVAIVISAFAFGLFHTLSLTDLSSQKFLPSFLAGLILAWIAIKSGSLFPGIVLHTLNNGILVSLAYYEDRLVAAGWIREGQTGFPTWILVTAGVGLALGALLTWLINARSDDEAAS